MDETNKTENLWCMRIILFGTTLLLSLPCFAEGIVWNDSLEGVLIGESVYFLEDEEGVFGIEDVASPDFAPKFKRSQQLILNFGFTESYYWLKFFIQNRSDEDIVFEIAAASLPITDFYIKRRSGEVTKIEAGYNIGLNNKAVRHHFQIALLPRGDYEVYVKVLSNTHPLPLRLWSKDKYEVVTCQQRLGYGVYIGLMLFVIVSNVFFAFTLRSLLNLFYACLVFVYMCYAGMVMDGFALYFFPKLDLMFWYTTIPPIGIVIQTAYCLAFLEVRKYLPRLNRIVSGFIGYFTLYAVLKFALPLVAVMAINTTHALISFFIMGFVGVMVGRSGNRLGYYYAFAYFIYFGLVLTEALYIQTGFPPYFTGLSHVALATLIEAFVLSYLLSKRFEWQRNEVEQLKYEKQVQLVETAKENERIVARQNVLLEEEVANRTKKLQDMNKELKIAAATKDKFFSIISHDLRNPFSAIVGYTSMLNDNYNVLHENQRKEYVGNIWQASQHTLKLLDNLLYWSRSQTGVMKFSPKKESLTELLDEVLSLPKQLAADKSIAVKIESFDEAQLLVDKDMFAAIIRNLFSNAVKFTPRGGEISLKVQATGGGYILLSISDNGVGISSEIKSRLFSLAGGITTVGTEDEKGTGLGLMLCKEFVEKHGGRIWVTSEVNKGSTFSFTVPCVQ
jgi:signal transduction histidine kinase